MSYFRKGRLGDLVTIANGMGLPIGKATILNNVDLKSEYHQQLIQTRLVSPYLEGKILNWYSPNC